MCCLFSETTVALTVFVLLGNVVTQYRCGGRKNFTFTRHKFLLVTVKKMVKIGAELPKLFQK